MKQKLLLIFVSLVVFLLLLEGASRVFEYFVEKPTQTQMIKSGWQAEFFKSFLDWHEPDPDLLWRYKANLNNRLIRTNSDHLIGDEIPLRKEKNQIRILVLGDSSPVGIGLENRNESFAATLERLLELQFHGSKKFEVINGAVSGYTSEQVKRFLELRGWKYNPDLVILYCGNNDASVSGYYSDRQIFNEQKLVGLRKALSNLALYRVMRCLLVGGKTKQNANTGLSVRVSPDEYFENLLDISEQCRSHDCRLIVCVPPVPMLWPAGLQFKTLTHITGEMGELIFPIEMINILGRNLEYCIDSLVYRGLYGEGDVFTHAVFNSIYVDSSPPDEVEKHYLNLDSLSSLDLNNLGVTYWRMNDFDRAFETLLSAHKYQKKEFSGRNTITADVASAPIYFNTGMTRVSKYCRAFPDSALISWIKQAPEAYDYLDSALQSDYFSLRIKRPYVESIKQLSSDSGVYVFNIQKLFDDNNGEYLFIDHCHPTARGHRLIADELARIISSRTWF